MLEDILVRDYQMEPIEGTLGAAIMDSLERWLNKRKKRKATMNYRYLLQTIFNGKMEEEIERFNPVDKDKARAFYQDVQEAFLDNTKKIYDIWEEIIAKSTDYQEQYKLLSDYDPKYREWLYDIKHKRQTLQELRSSVTNRLGDAANNERRFDRLHWLINGKSVSDMYNMVVAA